MRGNSHVRCEAGEKLETISKVYLSLLTVFGGFAPNSETAEIMSKNLGEQTILSGSVTQSKANGSKSLQMMSRSLMTVDELKTMPKFHFIVSKTGANPMKTKLDLFFRWGIELNDEYMSDKNEVREVFYAGRQEVLEEIRKKHGIKNEEFSEKSAKESSGEGMEIAPARRKKNVVKEDIRVGTGHHKANQS